MFITFLFVSKTYGQNELKYTQRYFKTESVVNCNRTCPTFELNVSVFTSDNELANSINRVIKHSVYDAIGVIGGDELPEEYWDEYYESLWNEDSESPFCYDMLMDEFIEISVDRHVEASTSVVYHSDKLIIVKIVYGFGYGDDDYHNTKSLIFTPKKWIRRSNELFKSEYEIKKIAEKIFRQQYKIPQDNDINSTGFNFENNEFHLPETVIITKSHLEFYDYVYDEKPKNVDNQIIIKIPIEKVKHLLNYMD